MNTNSTNVRASATERQLMDQIADAEREIARLQRERLALPPSSRERQTLDKQRLRLRNQIRRWAVQVNKLKQDDSFGSVIDSPSINDNDNDGVGSLGTDDQLRQRLERTIQQLRDAEETSAARRLELVFAQQQLTSVQREKRAIQSLYDKLLAETAQGTGDDQVAQESVRLLREQVETQTARINQLEREANNLQIRLVEEKTTSRETIRRREESMAQLQTQIRKLQQEIERRSQNDDNDDNDEQLLDEMSKEIDRVRQELANERARAERAEKLAELTRKELEKASADEDREEAERRDERPLIEVDDNGELQSGESEIVGQSRRAELLDREASEEEDEFADAEEHNDFEQEANMIDKDLDIKVLLPLDAELVNFNGDRVGVFEWISTAFRAYAVNQEVDDNENRGVFSFSRDQVVSPNSQAPPTVDLTYNTTPGELALKTSERAVLMLFEALVDPLFKAWATDGRNSADSDWSSSVKGLHGRYWSDGVVPFLTAIALQLTESYFADEEREKSDAEDAHPQNDALRHAWDLFRDLLEFVVVKGLTGNEALRKNADGALETTLTNEKGYLQALAPRADSYFDQFDIYMNNRSISATLGDEDTVTTRNQLFRFDRKADGKTRNEPTRAQSAKSTFAVVSAPLLKLVHVYAESENSLKTFNNNGKHLWNFTTPTKPGPVDFKGLKDDTEPVTTPFSGNPDIGILQENTPSLQSFESWVSRVFALPVFDALYWRDLAKIVSNNVFSLQRVGGCFPELYVKALGVLPLFFEPDKKGVDVVTFVQKSDCQLLRTDGSMEFIGPQQGFELVVRSFRGVVGTPGNFKISYESSPAGRLLLRTDIGEASVDLFDGVPVGKEQDAENLFFPALVQQIANVRDLYEQVAPRFDRNVRRPVADDGSTGYAEQLRALHTLVVGPLFAPVAISRDEPKKEQISFFDRYGVRPDVQVPTANGNQTLVLRSNAKANVGVANKSKTVQTDVRFGAPRFLLRKLPNSILGEKERKNEIDQYKSYLRGKSALQRSFKNLLSSTNEGQMTVLVPDDDAILRFIRTRGYQDSPNKNKYLNDHLLLHVIKGELDFAEIRNDRLSRKGVLRPTQLIVNGTPTILRIRVANYSDSRGGEIYITSGSEVARDSAGAVIDRISVTSSRRAKNGVYYIIDRVIEGETAIAEAMRQSNKADSPAPRPGGEKFALRGADADDYINDVYGVDIDASSDESIEGVVVDSNEQSPLRQDLDTPPALRTPPLAFTTRPPPFEPIRRSNAVNKNSGASSKSKKIMLKSELKKNERKSSTNSAAKQKIQLKNDVSASAAYVEQMRKPIDMQSVNKTRDALQGTIARASDASLERSRADFSEWKKYMKHTGVMAEIKDKVLGSGSDNTPVHLFVPTPQALEVANVQLSSAPASLFRSHVAIGRLPNELVLSKAKSGAVRGSKTSNVVVDSEQLHALHLREKSTFVDTLQSGVSIEHLPSKGSAKNVASSSGQLALHDIDFREPPYSLEVSKGKPQVHVHFIHKVLHQDQLLSNEKSVGTNNGVVASRSSAKKKAKGMDLNWHTLTGAKPGTEIQLSSEGQKLIEQAMAKHGWTGSGDKTSKSAATAAPAAECQSPGDAGVVKSSAHLGVGEQWLARTDELSEHLASADDNARYLRHLEQLELTLDGYGGSDGLLRSLDNKRVQDSLKKLRNSVARNRYIDPSTRAEAHTIIEKIRDRFPDTY